MRITDRASFAGGRTWPLKRRFSVCLTLLFFFLLWAAVGASAEDIVCTDCHYLPHGSACGTCSLSCHSNKLNNINHPTGPGTPLADSLTDQGKVAACVTCHVGPGMIHPFRINTDATVILTGYVDLDHACGQCHGGDTGGSAVAQSHGAPYFTTAQLSKLATDIHNTYPTANFAWTNDGATSYQVVFNAVASTCPAGLNCSYSWDFGDGGNGSGAVVSHQYADGNPREVILTVTTDTFTSDAIAKVVIPEAIHQFPVCGGNLEGTYTISKGSTEIPAARINELVTFTDGSSSNSSGSAGVFINWGDGSAVSADTAGTGSSLSHSYIWRGNYMVTQIVQDDMGYSCSRKYPISIRETGAAASSGYMVITTDADIQTSYYVKSRDSFGNWVTVKSGSFADGGTTVLLAPDEYEVYLYFADDHSCQWKQGEAAAVTDGGTTTVNAVSCK